VGQVIVAGLVGGAGPERCGAVRCGAGCWARRTG